MVIVTSKFAVIPFLIANKLDNHTFFSLFLKESSKLPEFQAPQNMH